MTTQEREKSEQGLRLLESAGWDVKPMWKELAARIDLHENGVPQEVDRMFTCPTVAPKIGDHMGEGQLQELAAFCLWPGYHYKLTPGQRRWFREFTGMTPSATVTIAWLELWKGTQHPRSFKIVSDVHIDPRNRKHTITEWVVREAGKFFQECASIDMEEAPTKTLSLHVGPCNVWTAKHRWAVEDLVGVKLKGEVAIEFVDDMHIRFTDEAGRIAEVVKEEFLSTVTDYVRLHDEVDAGVKKERKARVNTSVSGFEEFIASLNK